MNESDLVAAIEAAVRFADTSVIVRSPSAVAEVKGPLNVRSSHEWLTLGEENGSHVHARLSDMRTLRFRQAPDANAALEVLGEGGCLLFRISFRNTNRSRPEKFDPIRFSAVADRFARLTTTGEILTESHDGTHS